MNWNLIWKIPWIVPFGASWTFWHQIRQHCNLPLFYPHVDQLFLPMARFSTFFCSDASILVLLAIAVDRYRKVCQPFKSQLGVSNYISLYLTISHYISQVLYFLLLWRLHPGTTGYSCRQIPQGVSTLQVTAGSARGQTAAAAHLCDVIRHRLPLHALVRRAPSSGSHGVRGHEVRGQRNGLWDVRNCGAKGKVTLCKTGALRALCKWRNRSSLHNFDFWLLSNKLS